MANVSLSYRSRRVEWSYLLAAAVASLVLGLLGYWQAWPFSPDSWSYYELAGTVLDDFYAINTWRQYQYPLPYGLSFPPLWPLLIAMVDAVTGLGIHSGVALNVLISLATLALLHRLTDVLVGEPAWAVMLYLALLANTVYLTEIAAARSLPLSVLLWIALLIVFLRREVIAPRDQLLLGVLAGLSFLNRFDFLLPGVALGACVAMFSQGRPAALLRYYLAFVVGIAPWAGYCLHHFGRPFISDNARTVLAAEPVFVTDFFVNPPPTVFDVPWQWLTLKLSAMVPALKILIMEVAILNLWASGLFVAGLLYGWWPGSSLRPWWDYPPERRRRCAQLLSLAVPLAALVGSVLLTGYAGARYFVLVQFYGVLVALLWFDSNRRAVGADDSSSPLVVATLLAVVLANGLVLQRQSGNVSTANDARPAIVRQCLAPLDDPGLLVLDGDGPSTPWFRLGASSDQRVFIKPANLTPDTLPLLLERFPIDTVLVAESAYRPAVVAYGGRRLDCPLPVYHWERSSGG